jgi:hypothetical protein
MRIYGPALFALFTLLASSPAGAADADALRQFGILGTLAIDCSKPYGDSNPYLIYAATPEGGATRTLRKNESLNATLAIRNVQMAGPNVLEYDETGRQSELRTHIAKIEGKFRSWRSVRTSGPENGAVLIADGKFASGGPTPAFTFCHAN